MVILADFSVQTRFHLYKALIPNDDVCTGGRGTQPSMVKYSYESTEEVIHVTVVRSSER
jgi:hypothetical protein